MKNLFNPKFLAPGEGTVGYSSIELWHRNCSYHCLGSQSLSSVARLYTPGALMFLQLDLERRIEIHNFKH
jgi:hypothetical protein